MEKLIYRRIWCKECNDFEVHYSDMECGTCGTEYSDIKLSEIEEYKILEQRKRYKKQVREKMMSFYNEIGLTGSGSKNIMQELFAPENNVEILESDAGQLDIDNKMKEVYARRAEERRIVRDEIESLREKFKSVGRNDRCLCSSDLKFKMCCYSKVYKKL